MKLKITAEMAKTMAAALKRSNPDLTPTQIAEAIAGVQASTDAQRLRWGLEDRERELAAQKALSGSHSAARPEPIAHDRQPEQEKAKDAKF